LGSATITDAAGNALTLTPTPATVTGVTINDCPNIGNVCSNGSIYAGVSPDLNKAMYLTRCDAGMTWNGTACTGTALTPSWNDASGLMQTWLDTSLANCTSPSFTQSTCWTGKGNSSTLATADSSSAAGIQNHNAAQYCENLTAHSQTDWYLPAKDELNVLYTNRTTIGGFALAVYWSSSERASNSAWTHNFSNNNQFFEMKHLGFRVRCVRRVN
jgi:hypothetical protein